MRIIRSQGSREGIYVAASDQEHGQANDCKQNENTCSLAFHAPQESCCTVQLALFKNIQADFAKDLIERSQSNNRFLALLVQTLDSERPGFNRDGICIARNMECPAGCVFILLNTVIIAFLAYIIFSIVALFSKHEHTDQVNICHLVFLVTVSAFKDLIQASGIPSHLSKACDPYYEQR